MLINNNVSNDYNDAMASVRAEVEAYCAANGIDPEEFLINLDQQKSVSSVLNNPLYDEIYKLCYVSLSQILEPETYQSLESQIGHPPSFEEISNATSSEMTSLINDMIEDDPQMMSYFALKAGGQPEYQRAAELVSLAIQGEENSDIYKPATDYARDFYNEYDLNELDWIIDKEDYFMSAESSILDRLNEYDQSITDLAKAFNDGEINEQTFNAEMGNYNYARETMMAMLQEVTQAKSTFFNIVSELLKSLNDMQQQIAGRSVVG